MKGREIKVCKQHPRNDGLHCLSCDSAIDWNCWRQLCHCGAKSIGYRAMAADTDVEFFCREHFQDVPEERLAP